MPMKLMGHLFIVFVSCFAQANVEIKFKNNRLDETYKIASKSIELINKNGTKIKNLSANETKILESQLLEIFWSSKQKNESLKTKCVPYAEIQSVTESRVICEQDHKNKNKTFTILNTLSRYFK